MKQLNIPYSFWLLSNSPIFNNKANLILHIVSQYQKSGAKPVLSNDGRKKNAKDLINFKLPVFKK